MGWLNNYFKKVYWRHEPLIPLHGSISIALVSCGPVAQMPRITEDSYKQACALAEIAEHDLKTRIANALRSLGDPNLVRAKFAESRVKDLESLERKAKSNGWEGADALRNPTDLVGLRVVCNNLQDVRRAADLIKASLGADEIEAHEQDYITRPGKGGYRAIHLDVRVPTRLHAQELVVGCEIQIRTLLQDAWARLSHADIYGQGFEPSESLLGEMERLASQLARADKQAENVRKKMARPVHGRQPAKGARLNRSSIAFLYQRAFGESAPTYLVKQAFDEFSETEIRADGLDQALHDEQLIEKLKKAYQSYMPYEPSSEEMFRWVVIATVYGQGQALKQARRAGKREWDEVDQIYRREALSGLPDKIDEVLDALDTPHDGLDFGQYADVFGATSECAICGTTIIDSYSLAEALVDHYGLKDPQATEVHQKIEGAIDNSGLEVGHPDHPTLCSYHGDRFDKDD